MEKKFFTGMAVLLLGASLFFFGCGGDDDGSDGTGDNTDNTVPNWFDGLGTDLTEAADGSVTLTVTTTLLSAKVTVPAGKTLVVDSGKTLSIGSGGSLAGTVASGSTAAAAVIIKGTVTGGENFYAAGTALAANAIAAGIYAWDADANGGSTAGWKQTALDVKAAYSLHEDMGGTTGTSSGVTLVSALKNTATGLVTVKLGGAFDAKYLYYGDGKLATAAKAGTKWDRGNFGPHDCKPLTGAYGIVNIKGFVPSALTNVAVESINPALVVYTDVTSLTVSNTDLQAPAVAGTYPNTHINGDDSQRWVLYPTLPQYDVFSIMLYGGAAAGNKKVTLDFDQWSATSAGGKVTTGADGGDILDVVIDYSDVGFTATGTETDVSADYSLRQSYTDNAAAVDADFGVSIASAKKNPATNTVTIKLTGKFGGKWLYAADGEVSSDASAFGGAKWNTDAWGPAGCTPVQGKYGAVYIKGFGGTSGLSNIAIESISPALVMYSELTAVGMELSETKLGVPAGNDAYPNIYLAGDASQRWMLHTGIAATKPLGILLFDGAATGNKTVTLDIDQYSGSTAGSTKVTTGADGGDILNVVIDYSEVDFTNAIDKTE
jgi:hypothetical protein